MSKHPANETAGPIAPQQDIIDRFLDSVKVSAATDCPKHPNEQLCKCPVALAKLQPDDIVWCKEQYFRRIWENRLLDSEHAYEYNGTQQSHHAFTAVEGETPKHFARGFLQDGLLGTVFAPAGRLQDTIKAMLDFWKMRTKQWREMYGDRKAAKSRWSKDEWPEPEPDAQHKKSPSIPTDWFSEDQMLRPGSTLPMADFTCGPPWHRNTVTLMAIDCVEAAQNDTAKVHMVKCGIVNIQRCHEDCEMSEKIISEGMPKFVNEMTKIFFGKKNAQPVNDLIKITDGKAAREAGSMAIDKMVAELCLRDVTIKANQQEEEAIEKQ